MQVQHQIVLDKGHTRAITLNHITAASFKQ